jgi:hypothetical protein
MRLVGPGIKTKKINGACAAGSGTDMRHLLAQQGIDQTGFADVGASKKSELRRTFWRKKFRIGRGRKKFGDDRFHSVTN